MNNYLVWIFLTISATTYALSFIYIEHYWFLIFIFPFPLLYAAQKYSLTFKHGYFWGLLSNALHTSGVLLSLHTVAPTVSFLNNGIIIFTILYLALYAGIWFFIMHFLLHGNNYSITLKIYCWLLSLLIYFFVMDRICLWPFLRIEGYPFFYPLLPLTQYLPLLYWLPWLGKTILFCIYLCIPAHMFIYCNNQQLHTGILCFASISFIWLGCYLYESLPLPPSWISHFIVIPYIIPTQDQNALAATINTYIRLALIKNPKATCVIFPESAVYLDTWNPLFVKQICTGTGNNHIIIGSFHNNGQQLYNTLYHLYAGSIMHMFHKQHTLIITEELPYWCNSLLHPYATDFPLRTAGSGKRPLLSLSNNSACIPYICSEFFFCSSPTSSNVPLLVLANDWWFSYAYPKKIIGALCQFKAIEWNTGIILAAYYQATYYDSNGIAYPMATL